MAFKEEILPVRYAMLGWFSRDLDRIAVLILGHMATSQFITARTEQQVTDQILSCLLFATLDRQRHMALQLCAWPKVMGIQPSTREVLVPFCSYWLSRVKHCGSDYLTVLVGQVQDRVNSSLLSLHCGLNFSPTKVLYFYEVFVKLFKQI